MKLPPSTEASVLPEILLVDDEVKSVKYLARCFSNQYKVHIATSADQGIEMLRQNSKIAVAICDQRMPDRTGAEFFVQTRQEFPSVVRIISTAYSDWDLLVASINAAGVFGYLDKPWNLPLVESLVANGIAYHESSGSKNDQFQILKPRTLIRHEIALGPRDIDHLVTILHVIKQQDPSARLPVKIAQFGDETILTIADNVKGTVESVSLSQLQELTLHKDLAEDIPLLDQVGMLTQVAVSTQSIGVAPQPYVELKPSGISLFQIRSSLDQLQIVITSILNILGNKTSRSAKVKQAIKSLRAIQSASREAILTEELLRDRAEKIIPLLTHLLDGINQTDTGERSVLQMVSPDYRSINSLFTNYNNLVSHLGGAAIAPDPGLLKLVSESRGKHTDGALYIFLLILLFIPLAVMGSMTLAKQQNFSGYDQILKYFILVCLSLLAALVGGKIVGNLSIEGDLDIPCLKGRPGLTKATGGFAAFLIVFLFGRLLV